MHNHCQDNATPGERLFTVKDGLQRAIAELLSIRLKAEDSFEQIRLHAGVHALDDPATVVAMQSVDAISQHIAAIETFLGNLAGATTGSDTIAAHAAARGITLEAVAHRLAEPGRSDGSDYESGVCDFFGPVDDAA